MASLALIQKKKYGNFSPCCLINMVSSPFKRMCITNIVTVPFRTYTHKPSNKYKHNPVKPVYQESQPFKHSPANPINIISFTSYTMQRLITLFLQRLYIPVYVIDHACSVKMAGDWLKTQKGTRPIFSHLNPTILVNEGFITWPKRELILAGPTREIPSKVHLAPSSSQSECGICFILPGGRLRNIIKRGEHLQL